MHSSTAFGDRLRFGQGSQESMAHASQPRKVLSDEAIGKRLSLAEGVKDRGNQAFKVGKYQDAIVQYLKCIALVDKGDSDNKVFASQLQDVKLKAMMNIAQCYLNESEYPKCIQMTQQILDIDPSNSKAFYRKAKAHYHIKQFEMAFQSVENSLLCEPENQDAKTLMRQIKQCLPKGYEAPKSRQIASWIGGRGPAAAGSSVYGQFVGIVNEGATCYLNAFLQAFFSLASFRKLLYQFDGEGPMTCALQELFSEMECRKIARQCGPKHAVTTTKLMKSFGWTDADALQQQDIGEFCSKFFEMLENQLTKGSDAFNTLKRNMFGTTRTTVSVKEVKYTSERRNELHFIVISSVKDHATLEDAMTSQMKPESVEDYKVDDHEGKYTASIQTDYPELPPILAFVVQRTEYVSHPYFGFVEAKIGSRMSFPFEMLLRDQDGMPVTPDELSQRPGGSLQEKMKSGERLFDCFAVLNHAGVATAGHYFTFARPELQPNGQGRWYRFDDEQVTPVAGEEVEKQSFGGTSGTLSMGRQMPSSTAYMLLYVERKYCHDHVGFDTSDFIPKSAQSKYSSSKAVSPLAVFSAKAGDGERTIGGIRGGKNTVHVADDGTAEDALKLLMKSQGFGVDTVPKEWTAPYLQGVRRPRQTELSVVLTRITDGVIVNILPPDTRVLGIKGTIRAEVIAVGPQLASNNPDGIVYISLCFVRLEASENISNAIKIVGDPILLSLPRSCSVQQLRLYASQTLEFYELERLASEVRTSELSTLMEIEDAVREGDEHAVLDNASLIQDVYDGRGDLMGMRSLCVVLQASEEDGEDDGDAGVTSEFEAVDWSLGRSSSSGLNMG